MKRQEAVVSAAMGGGAARFQHGLVGRTGVLLAEAVRISLDVTIDSTWLQFLLYYLLYMEDENSKEIEQERIGIVFSQNWTIPI